jgi:oligo-1,6-glucosidase
MLNTFLLSMRGTPYTYYGDELGMTNIDMPTIEEYVDIEARGKYQAAASAGEDLEAFMEVLNYNSRENGRTPMQWDNSGNAGFTTGTPWKRVNENYTTINVADQDKDPNSVLNHFRRMTRARKDNPVLVYGEYEILQKDHPDVYAYTRTSENAKMLVLLNFSQKVSSIDLPEISAIQKPVINNYDAYDVEASSIKLLPYQALIFELQ